MTHISADRLVCPLAARLVEVVSPRGIRDQVGRPYCQEHEDDGRIDYWSGGKAKETRACSASIRHTNEKKYSGDPE